MIKVVSDPQTCLAWLARAGLTLRSVADRTEHAYCQVTNAGRLVDPL